MLAANNPIGFSNADSLYDHAAYSNAALEYERVYYSANDPTLKANALLRKAYCKKALGQFDKAIFELDRINQVVLADTMICKIQYEKALCNYLLKKYSVAENNLVQMYNDVTDSLLYQQSLYLYVLVLNEQGKWSEAQPVFNKYMAYKGCRNDTLKEYDFLKKKHVFINAKTANLWSSFIPGSGQIYSGFVFHGITGMALEGISIFFLINNFTRGFYFSGIFSGLIPSSALYFGQKRYTNFLVNKKNKKMKHEIQIQIKSVLLHFK